ncbi:hypothetical protein JOM56_008115 [Amanita muscaria]
MRTKFPILNLANGDWKANMFATTRYPNWNRHHRVTGHLKRKYPSLRSSGVGEPNDGHQSKKKQKRKAAKVIDISDDEDGASAASHSSTSHTAHSLSTAPRQKPPCSSTSTEIVSGKHKRPHPRPRPQHRDNADATPAASSDSGDIPAPLSTNKQNMLPPVSISELGASVASACAIDAPTSSVQPCANASAPSPTPAGVAAGTSATAAASVASACAIDTPTSAQPFANASAPSPTPTGVAAAQDVQPPTTTNTDPPATTETPTTTSRQPLSSALSSVDNSGTLALFNDLRIPEPVQQVPLQTTSINTITATTAASETRKKGKIMVPQSNSVTARNLFALDHMQQHPTTTATEFGRLWKDLDKDTRDKYDAMSKEKNIEKKKAQKLPK